MRNHEKIQLAYHPERGWALKPGFVDAPAKVIVNSRGIRSLHEHSYKKTKGRPRILFLGDSYTFGDEVADNETYCAYLQAMLPQTEILNFGVCAYGHDQMLLYYKTEGVKYSPDIVMLCFLSMDIQRNVKDFFIYQKPRYDLVGNDLVLRNVPVIPPDAMYKKLLFSSRFLELADIVWQYSRGGLPQYKDENAYKITAAILDELLVNIRRSNAIPVLFYVPYNGEVKQDLLNKPRTNDAVFLENYCRQRKVLWFSVSNEFVQSIRNGKRLKMVGHWDAAGNHIIAKKIKDFLLRNKLVSSRANDRIGLNAPGNTIDYKALEENYIQKTKTSRYIFMGD